MNGYHLRVFALLMGLCGCLLSQSSLAAPRLLDYYIPGTGPKNISPLTLLFSEPIDPQSIILPNADNTNPDRSFEVRAQFPWGNDLSKPLEIGATQVTMREGGRMVEISASPSTFWPGEHTVVHLFRNGFRSLTGEPLERDYRLTVIPDFGVEYPTVRLRLPTVNQPLDDPNAPLSIYFTNRASPEWVQVELLTGANGSPIGPLDLEWDTPAPQAAGAGYLHLKIGHPPLPPSPRPYVIRLYVRPYQAADDRNLVFDLPFTVGPSLAGDLNNNGRVEITDAIRALRLVTSDNAGPEEVFSADLSPNGQGKIGDGRIGIQDVVLILRRAVGLERGEGWPAESFHVRQTSDNSVFELKPQVIVDSFPFSPRQPVLHLKGMDGSREVPFLFSPLFYRLESIRYADGTVQRMGDRSFACFELRPTDPTETWRWSHCPGYRQSVRSLHFFNTSAGENFLAWSDGWGGVQLVEITAPRGRTAALNSVNIQNHSGETVPVTQVLGNQPFYTSDAFMIVDIRIVAVERDEEGRLVLKVKGANKEEVFTLVKGENG